MIYPNSLSADWHLQEDVYVGIIELSVDWHLQEDVGIIEVYTREETTQDVNHTQTANFLLLLVKLHVL